MSDDKLKIKVARKSNGLYEVNGVLFDAKDEQDAVRKYLRRKKC